MFVLMNVYNEAPNLPRAVQSVRNSLDGRGVIPCFVFVDGKYPDYEAPDDLSTDGTREYALANGCLIDCVDYECEKRTAGLRLIDELASDGDYVLYLDADEEIKDFFGWPTKVGIVSFEREKGNVQYDRARLYRWEAGLEFRRRHYELWQGDDLVADLCTAGPNHEGEMVGTGIHHNCAHSPERFRTKRTYYKKLKERER